jgi:hypothetical protein
MCFRRKTVPAPQLISAVLLLFKIRIEERRSRMGLQQIAHIRGQL